MENASKALLIAASVLIVILIVTFGLRILSSTNETTQQAQGVGEMISLASKDAIAQISINDQRNKEEETKIIKFTIEGAECSALEGMTWKEWVESIYNTKGVKIYKDGDYQSLSLDGYELQINGTSIEVDNNNGPQLNWNLKKDNTPHPQ